MTKKKPVTRPKVSSKGRLLDAAAASLRERGYNATSISAVARDGKAPMGSVYFHFPGGKEQLAGEAIGSGVEAIATQISETMSNQENPAKAIADCARVWARDLQNSDFKRGCPIAASALEFAATSDTLRMVAVDGFAVWRDLFEQRLVSAGVGPETAQETAMVVLSLLEGAELMARVERDTSPLHLAADTIEQVVQSKLIGTA